ncbi:MAG: hypothetical protein R6V21_01270, partial [Pelovirga sp.]
MTMMVLTLILVFLALAYFRVDLRLWSVALILFAVAIGFALNLPMGGIVALVVLTAVIIAIINLSFLRQQILTRPLFQLFHRMLPTLSDTEREALEAGTVGWDGELFSADPDWKKLFDQPAAALSEEEQAFLDGPVEELCRMLDDWQITEIEKDLPFDVWQYLKEQRFFGMIIPLEYGGLGFSALAHS